MHASLKASRRTQAFPGAYFPEHIWTQSQRKQTPNMHADFVFALEEKVLIMTVRNRTPLTIVAWALTKRNLRHRLGATGCTELNFEQRCAPQAALANLQFVSHVRHSLHICWCKLARRSRLEAQGDLECMMGLFVVVLLRSSHHWLWLVRNTYINSDLPSQTALPQSNLHLCG